jgi:dephospho-CoA kinase
LLKNENFFIIRLIGKNQDDDKSIWETDLDHLTQKNFHFWIENTGSKKDLKHQVDQIAKEIIQKKTPHILP